MAIWPFHAKPVVTPFWGPFTPQHIYIDGPLAVGQYRFVIPDSVFAIPTAVVVQATSTAAAHGAGGFHLDFISSNEIIHRAGFHAFAAAETLLITWFHGCAFNAPGPANLNNVAPMAFPIHLRPNDSILLTITNYVALDVINFITIHAMVWEIY
jgi:hypothetical protein